MKENQNINLKNEPIISNEILDKKEKSSLRTKLKIHDFKEIMSMTSQIFLQLFLSLIITQINAFMFGWYDNSTYQAVMNKVTIFYTTFQFVPSLVASGVIIVGNNFLGQGRNKELPQLIASGVIVNVSITCIVVLMTNIFSEQFFKFLDINTTNMVHTVKNGQDIYPTMYKWNEMDFARKYYIAYSCQLVFLGITQVYISSLQTIKKQIHVTIGSIIANLIDAIFIALALFVFKWDPIVCSLSILIATIFQMGYMCLMAHICVDYSGQKNIFKNINFKYMQEIVKVGLPITLEMGLWNICNFTCQAGIAAGTGNSFDLHEPGINLHRAVWSFSQYSSAFLQAMGTVTSMYVSKRVGAGDLDGAYKEGINCWKLSFYSQVVLSVFMFALCYPYLLIMSIEPKFILAVGFPMYSLIFIKMCGDTVNMTLLRALWAVGDLWIPLVISIFTMGIFLALIPILVGHFVSKALHNSGDHNDGAHTMYIIYGSICGDPVARSIIYTFIWRSKKWKKYAKKY